MADKLKTVVFHQADYGALGSVVIALPENNGGDEQFEADFDACTAFVHSVMMRRRVAAAQAIEARRAAAAKTDAVVDESAVGDADAPKQAPDASDR